MNTIQFGISGGLVQAEATFLELNGLSTLRRSRLLLRLRIAGSSAPDLRTRILSLRVETLAESSTGACVALGYMTCPEAIGITLSQGAQPAEIRSELVLDSQQIEALDARRGRDGLTLLLRAAGALRTQQRRVRRRRAFNAGTSHTRSNGLERLAAQHGTPRVRVRRSADARQRFARPRSSGHIRARRRSSTPHSAPPVKR